MKILILSWNFPPVIGGIESLVGNLTATLRSQGHEVQVVTQHQDHTPAMEGVVRAGKPGLRPFLTFCLLQGFREAKCFQPDVILCGSITTIHAAWLISSLTRTPFFVILYGADLLKLPRTARTLAVALLNRSRGVVAISRATRALAVECGVRRPEVAVIPPGVEAAQRDRPISEGSRKLLAQIGERPLLMSVGRLVRRKGFLEFVEQAMPILLSRHPDLLYLVVGEDATGSLAHRERLKDTIQQRVQGLGLSDHVQLLGEVDAELLHNLLRRADCLVMPSLERPDDMEGFGIVFLEAALAKTPAVATSTGGIPDAVTDGETGILCPPGDFPAIAAALDRLLRDSSLRQTMGEEATRRAQACFDWDTIAHRYVDFLHDVVGTG